MAASLKRTRSTRPPRPDYPSRSRADRTRRELWCGRRSRCRLALAEHEKLLVLGLVVLVLGAHRHSSVAGAGRRRRRRGREGGREGEADAGGPPTRWTRRIGPAPPPPPGSRSAISLAPLLMLCFPHRFRCSDVGFWGGHFFFSGEFRSRGRGGEVRG
jgi:hypothetical protein